MPPSAQEERNTRTPRRCGLKQVAAVGFLIHPCIVSFDMQVAPVGFSSTHVSSRSTCRWHLWASHPPMYRLVRHVGGTCGLLIHPCTASSDIQVALWAFSFSGDPPRSTWKQYTQTIITMDMTIDSHTHTVTHKDNVCVLSGSFCFASRRFSTDADIIY